MPKTGGRQKHEWTAAELRSVIMDEIKDLDELVAIAKRKPMMVSGPTGKNAKGYPTIADSLKAWELLLRKALPDLQAMALTGQDGGPITTQRLEADGASAAQAVLDMLQASGALVTNGSVPNGAELANAAQLAGGVPADVAAVEGHGFAPSTAVATNGHDHNALVPVDDHWPQPNGKARPKYQVGERILIGASGYSLEFMHQGNDGRCKFFIVDPHGTRLTTCWTEEVGREMIDELIETGSIAAR